MKKLVITAELETKIKELQDENKSLILDLTLNDSPNGVLGRPSEKAAPLVDEVFDLCYDDEYNEELNRLVNIFGYEYRLGQITAYMQLYGYEVKKPKIIQYVAYVMTGENKVYYGSSIHTATNENCTRFHSNKESSMNRLEELERHGWAREEIDLTNYEF